MTSSVLSAIAVTVVLAAFGVANAQEPVKLTDKQLTKITAGATNINLQSAHAFVNNGAGPHGINVLSPSSTAVAQNQTALGLNLFTIDSGPSLMRR